MGRDPIHNRKVNCELSTKSGKLAPKTKYQTAARKFRQLKILVLWLQKQPRFGNYCYYGCYCLPEGAHDLSGGGYGEPVDMIDRYFLLTLTILNEIFAISQKKVDKEKFIKPCIQRT